MTVGYLSPLWGAGAQLFDLQGKVLAGGYINTFLAGTTTPQTTYTDATLATPNGVSFQLDSSGRTTQEMWIPAGTPLKFQLTDYTGAQVGPLFDNITGVNDPGVGATGISVWSAVTATPSYINSTSFSQPGDLRTTYPVGTRVRFTVTAGTGYGTVSAVAYSTFTTVTVIPDGTVLDNGLSGVAVSINSVTGKNVSSAAVDYKSSLTYPAGTVGAAIQALGQTSTTAGTATAFTLSPPVPITSYVAGQIFAVQFNQASGNAPTLNVSAQGPKNLKQLGTGGTKVAAAVFTNQISYVAYDGTDLVVLEPVLIAATGRLLRITTITASGTWTAGAGTTSALVKMVGGGGGGGLAPGNGDSSGGGGGGGYSEKYISPVTSPQTVTIGAGGASNANGTSTVFGAYFTAGGGSAGTSRGGGPGGVGANGDFNTTGGGGSSGPSNSETAMGGSGGNSLLGGGAPANTGHLTVGVAAAANSGGGGGGSASAGGAGGSGVCIVYEYS